MILPLNTVLKRIFKSWDHGYKYSCTMSILILRIFEHTFNTLQSPPALKTRRTLKIIIVCKYSPLKIIICKYSQDNICMIFGHLLNKLMILPCRVLPVTFNARQPAFPSSQLSSKASSTARRKMFNYGFSSVAMVWHYISSGNPLFETLSIYANMNRNWVYMPIYVDFLFLYGQWQLEVIDVH